jgi:hypothetical protein
VFGSKNSGLEPAALLRDRQVFWCSNQLNYAPAWDIYILINYCASDTVPFPLVSSASLLCHQAVP